MKKYLFLTFLGLTCIFFTGCGKYGEKDIIKDLTKKIENSEGYHLDGVLEIINNEDKFLYDVDVAYKKDNNFRVSLKNQTNNHEQIILRNQEGVYVLTPSLNKSFKFQSEWPYNNSQSYLLQTILNDINNDEEKTFENTEDGYKIVTKVNYSNNKNLIKQNIYINKDINITKIEVLDENNNIQMTMNINNIDMKATYEDNYFDLNNNIKVSKENTKEDTKEKIKTTSKIEEIIYPMYLPENTYLSSEEKVSTKNGERVILTFAGDNPFMLVQETTKIAEDNLTIPVSGEPYLLSDTIGSIGESSANWISNGVEYYITSNKLTNEQLISVANSLSNKTISK